MKPRQPTQDELHQLEHYLTDHGLAIDPRVVIKYSASNAIAVFDDYQADNGGYRGTLLVVVWPDDPSYQQVFIWDRHGSLQLVPQGQAVVG